MIDAVGKKANNLKTIKYFMARSQETFNKKEKEKKKLKKKQEKLLKKEERKANSDKGKSLEEMFAYVDEDGNLTSTPPDPKKKREIKTEDIEISTSKKEDVEPEDPVRKGTITFFNDSKGYGFIKDHVTQDSVFVHINGLEDEVSENDKVTYETEMGQKGLNAVRVKLIKDTPKPEPKPEADNPEPEAENKEDSDTDTKSE